MVHLLTGRSEIQLVAKPNSKLLCVALNLLCKRDKWCLWCAASAKIVSRTVKKLDNTFNIVSSLSMVGDDSFVKQKTADNLVDKNFITDTEDSTTDGLIEDFTINVLMEEFTTSMRVE